MAARRILRNALGSRAQADAPFDLLAGLGRDTERCVTRGISLAAAALASAFFRQFDAIVGVERREWVRRRHHRDADGREQKDARHDGEPRGAATVRLGPALPESRD